MIKGSFKRLWPTNLKSCYVHSRSSHGNLSCLKTGTDCNIRLKCTKSTSISLKWVTFCISDVLHSSCERRYHFLQTEMTKFILNCNRLDRIKLKKWRTFFYSYLDKTAVLERSIYNLQIQCFSFPRRKGNLLWIGNIWFTTCLTIGRSHAESNLLRGGMSLGKWRLQDVENWWNLGLTHETVFRRYCWLRPHRGLAWKRPFA